MAKNTNRTTIGANIVELRKKLHYNQTAMAELIGVTRDCFAKYETTIIPPVDKLVAIAKVLDVSVDELVGVGGTYQPSRPITPVVTFAAVNPYLSNVEPGSYDNIIELSETEADLLLKFRETSEERQQKILKILEEA
ncbi:MAG: helix-turn-helix domain-containing protein [Ruminococcaceae bacterium]|nr:helix-turn-helix domain-containing protein [Oscillospiraceae bacterium]